MRAIIQRVMKASVTVGDELVSSINKGLCILVGISRDDTPKDMDYIVRKILNLRVFEDEHEKRWSKNVMDKQYEILCVSQFTLYHILKGNKPDFHSAMAGDESKAFYDKFLQQMGDNYQHDKIKDGLFGAYMQVNIQNDGPVTITIESPQSSCDGKEKPKGQPKQKEKKPGCNKSHNPPNQTAAAASEAHEGGTPAHSECCPPGNSEGCTPVNSDSLDCGTEQSAACDQVPSPQPPSADCHLPKTMENTLQIK